MLNKPVFFLFSIGLCFFVAACIEEFQLPAPEGDSQMVDTGTSLGKAPWTDTQSSSSDAATETETIVGTVSDSASDSETASEAGTSGDSEINPGTDTAGDTAAATDTRESTDTGDSADTGSVADTGSETDTEIESDTGMATDTGGETDTEIESDADVATDTSGETDTGFETDTGSDVDPVAPLAILATTIVDGDHNQDFESVFTATGGVAPYTFDAVDGVLPEGVRVTDGRLWGRPKASGEYAFVVQVTDALGNTANREFSWFVSRKKWVAYLNDAKGLALANLESGLSLQVQASPEGGRITPYSFSPSQRYFLYTVQGEEEDVNLRNLKLVELNDSGLYTAETILSGDIFSPPRWTPDGAAFSVSVRNSSSDSTEDVYWVPIGGEPIWVTSVGVVTTGSAYTIPIDNNTLFYVSIVGGAWLVDIDSGVVDGGSLQALTFEPELSALFSMELSRTTIGTSTYIDVEWQPSSYGMGGYVTAYHYLVGADGQTFYQGNANAGCYAHSSDYEWFFTGYGSEYGTSIVRYDNRGRRVNIDEDPVWHCGFNVQWDDTNQFVAYLEYTSPVSILVRDLDAVSEPTSEMLVSGDTLTVFGGMSGDGARMVAASTQGVYGANIIGGDVDAAQLLSPDLAGEAVNRLTMSPNGELAAYISTLEIFDDATSTTEWRSHVNVSDLLSMTHLTGYMDEEKHNDHQANTRLLRFTEDSANLLFVVQNIPSGGGGLGTSYLVNVDVANQRLSSIVGSINNIGAPEVIF